MMMPARKHKLLMILGTLGVLSIVTLLILFALRQNISLFYSPLQIARGEAPLNRSIRVGGMVVAGSIRRGHQDLSVQFDVTDYQQTIHVVYQGVLPDLFREGQGVVAQGQLHPGSTPFFATEILAKHDENYMPPEVKKALGRNKTHVS